MGSLVRLDSTVVPRLARGLARVSQLVRRWRVRPLTVVAAVLLLAVGVTAVWRLVRPEMNASTGTSPVWVGVRDGDSVPRYLDAARAKLARHSAESPGTAMLALVAFDRYLTPEQVRAALAVPDIGAVQAFARVPLPGRQTERVTVAADRLPEDLVAEMVGVADRKDLDAATYDRMADTEAGQQLRAIYASNADVSKAEAQAYRSGCACVFALLVRATPTALVTLAGQTGVRVVDPAPDVADADDAVFVPPLPEQVNRVEPLADDLLPGTG